MAKHVTCDRCNSKITWRPGVVALLAESRTDGSHTDGPTPTNWYDWDSHMDLCSACMHLLSEFLKKERE